MKEKLLKYQNGKLKQQLIFSIPANQEICGRECKGCYAIKFQKLYPNVLPYRERMYQASLQDDFVEIIIDEIKSCKKPLLAVRIHESGEWYSKEYVDKWCNIAKALPNTKFYAFTKRIKDFDFSSLMALDNFVLIDSLMYGKINYDKIENLDQAKPICPATLSKVDCNADCGYCWSKKAQTDGIQFIKH